MRSAYEADETRVTWDVLQLIRETAWTAIAAALTELCTRFKPNALGSKSSSSRTGGGRSQSHFNIRSSLVCVCVYACACVRACACVCVSGCTTHAHSYVHKQGSRVWSSYS